MALENVDRHEFYLKDYQVADAKGPVYRVALGQLIPEGTRQTFNPKHISLCHNQSGSIGFMDLVIRDHLLRNQANTRYETEKTLTILAIGIEPEHRRGHYAEYLLKQRAEEIAVEWGLNTIVTDSPTNPIMRTLCEKLGYQVSWNGSRAVKRLK